MNIMLHWLKHKLGLAPCDCVGIVHEPSCPGFCFITPGMKQCNWQPVLKARCCGKLIERS